MTSAEFERLIETFGSDFARWPASHAGSAAALLRQSAEARTMLDEARALDRLLDTQPASDAARLALLADRIVAQATGGSGQPTLGRRALASPASGGGNIIALPRPAGRSAPRPIPVANESVARGRPFNLSWRAAAALAASLLMGVAIGLTDLAQTTTLGVAALTDVSVSDAEGVISAVQYDSLGSLDEEQI